MLDLENLETLEKDKEKPPVSEKSPETEMNFDDEKTKEFAISKSEEIENFGEETCLANEEEFKAAVDDGVKLELPQDDINEVMAETKIAENLNNSKIEVENIVKEGKDGIKKEIEPDLEKKETALSLEDKEQAYLSQKIIKAKGLDKRYEDERSGFKRVQEQITEYSLKCGVKNESIPELENKEYNPDTKEIIKNKLVANLDALFLNKETGRFNPEKHQIMLAQTENYLNLMEEAQNEGDISKNINADEIFKLVEKNIELMAFQDRVASENTLGDHGVRHVVGYNIKITEQILNSVSEKGQEVKAIDRIMGHQIMLMHDLGYVCEPVRNEVNSGNPTADKGHNLLSAKILRQMAGSSDEALTKVFSQEQIATLHQGVLEHDDSKVNFHINDGDEKARQENLFSAVHLADNTHAFEDKLPEILYSVPESLKAMRLLKTAGEIGDSDMINSVKEKLILDINKHEEYSKDDKEILAQAVNNLHESSYKFSVGRICGNKPEVSIGQNGRVSIKIQESSIHQEAVGLFGQESYDQLKKFIGDLEGKEKGEITNEMLNQDKIEGKNVTLELTIGEKKSNEKTDYQKRIENIITDKDFVELSRQDLLLSRRQKLLEDKLNSLSNQSLESGEKEAMLKKTEENINKYKLLRSQIFKNYLK